MVRGLELGPVVVRLGPGPEPGLRLDDQPERRLVEPVRRPRWPHRPRRGRPGAVPPARLRDAPRSSRFRRPRSSRRSPSVSRRRRSRIEPPQSRRCQGRWLLPMTITLMPYSRAKARIVLATSRPRKVIGMPPSCWASSRFLPRMRWVAASIRVRSSAGRLDVDGVPGRVEPVGQPRRLAQQRRGVGAAAGEADHHPLGRRGRGPVGLGAAAAAVDQVGDLRQRRSPAAGSGWRA